MKYKLINITTKQETLCDKITIDEFDYYVSDDKIDVGDWVINNLDKGIGQTIREISLGEIEDKEYSKVIATNKPNIDIPKVVDEVEKLGIKNNEIKISTDIFPDAALERRWNFEGFQDGYNKSQETHSFSKEDLKSFGEFCAEYNYRLFGTKSYEELLQLWQEQQPKKVYYE